MKLEVVVAQSTNNPNICTGYKPAGARNTHRRTQTQTDTAKVSGRTFSCAVAVLTATSPVSSFRTQS